MNLELEFRNLLKMANDRELVQFSSVQFSQFSSVQFSSVQFSCILRETVPTSENRHSKQGQKFEADLKPDVHINVSSTTALPFGATSNSKKAYEKRYVCPRC